MLQSWQIDAVRCPISAVQIGSRPSRIAAKKSAMCDEFRGRRSSFPVGSASRAGASGAERSSVLYARRCPRETSIVPYVPMKVQSVGPPWIISTPFA